MKLKYQMIWFSKLRINDHIMRITNFKKDHKKIIQFLESSKSVPSCRLD